MKSLEEEETSASYLNNDELVARVKSGFEKIRESLPYIAELRARFGRVRRGSADIAGCRTWKEFCEKHLHRTDRRIRQVLAGRHSLRACFPEFDDDPAEAVESVLKQVERIISRTRFRISADEFATHDQELAARLEAVATRLRKHSEWVPEGRVALEPSNAKEP